MRHYLVTGATGVVGSALLRRLLDDADVHASLLVRAPDDAALAARTDALFDFWRWGSAEAAVRSRVHAIRGDATAPRFGLGASAYDALLGRTTHVVHAAGAVRMNLPLEQARHSACQSAHEILAFTWALHRAGKLGKLEFVSTVGVGGRMPTVPEQWIDTPREFHNTYEQSKAEAEQLVRQAVDDGLPVTVHRPSMVVGDSHDGRVLNFQIFYHLCEFLSGRRTLGLFPPLGDQVLDIVPADMVAGAIDWSSRTQATAGRVLHLCGGPSGAVPLEALRERVRACMQRRGLRLPGVRTLPGPLFVRLLRLAGLFVDARSRRALATLPVFLDYLATHQRFENRRTIALLAGAVGVQHDGWQAWLDTVLDHYLDQLPARRTPGPPQARDSKGGKS